MGLWRSRRRRNSQWNSWIQFRLRLWRIRWIWGIRRRNGNVRYWLNIPPLGLLRLQSVRMLHPIGGVGDYPSHSDRHRSPDLSLSRIGSVRLRNALFLLIDSLRSLIFPLESPCTFILSLLYLVTFR
ncbi:hypothetical protein PMAYCL1PPCAC_12676, partial [Pristionchus mayeri]